MLARLLRFKNHKKDVPTTSEGLTREAVMEGRITSTWKIEPINPQHAGNGTITSMYKVHRVIHPAIPKPSVAQKLLSGTFAYAAYILLICWVIFALKH